MSRRSRWGAACSVLIVLGAVAVLTWILVGRGSSAVAGSGSSPEAGSDEPVPSVQATGLDPAVERQFALAQAAAAADGIAMVINSGWRSASEQQEIVDQFIVKYGSEEEAHRWVLPPSESGHVRGIAIDVGPTDAAYWMDRYGATYGFCRTYASEVWHYELIVEPGGTCPQMHADASGGWS